MHLLQKQIRLHEVSKGRLHKAHVLSLNVDFIVLYFTHGQQFKRFEKGPCLCASNMRIGSDPNTFKAPQNGYPPFLASTWQEVARGGKKHGRCITKWGDEALIRYDMVQSCTIIDLAKGLN